MQTEQPDGSPRPLGGWSLDSREMLTMSGSPPLKPWPGAQDANREAVRYRSRLVAPALCSVNLAFCDLSALTMEEARAENWHVK